MAKNHQLERYHQKHKCSTSTIFLIFCPWLECPDALLSLVFLFLAYEGTDTGHLISLMDIYIFRFQIFTSFLITLCDIAYCMIRQNICSLNLIYCNISFLKDHHVITSCNKIHQVIVPHQDSISLLKVEAVLLDWIWLQQQS